MGTRHTCDHYDLRMGNDHKEHHLRDRAQQGRGSNTNRPRRSSQVRLGWRADDSGESSFDLAFVLSGRMKPVKVVEGNEWVNRFRDGHFAVPDGAGSWLFQLETAKYFSPGNEPDDACLLSGLAFNPGTQSTQDMTYFDYLNRVAPLIVFLRQIGVWDFPHPWINLFVPAANAQTLIGETLANLTVDDVGQGPIRIYPFNRELFRTPFFRVPDSRHFFVFALLRNAVPPTPERAAQLIEDNRTLFERAVALGGKRYPFDSVPMTRHDWQKHYQPLWGAFVSAKRHFDPDEILTPGQGIFS